MFVNDVDTPVICTETLVLVWTSEQNKANIRSSHTSNLANHLIECPLQTGSAREKAIEEKAKKGWSPCKHVAAPSSIPLSITVLTFNAATSHAPVAYMEAGPSTGLTGHFGGESWPSALDPHLRYHPYASHLHSVSPFSSASSMRAESIAPMSSVDGIAPSDSASFVMASNSRPNSRSSCMVVSGRNLSWCGSLSPLIPAPEYLPWTTDRKKCFERRVLHLTAAAGFLLSWVENPEWAKLCDEFMPGAPHISRKVYLPRGF